MRMMMPSKRQISGTSEVVLKGGEKFFGRFASQFQIKPVGINIDLI
jgi:hypothetical protein